MAGGEAPPPWLGVVSGVGVPLAGGVGSAGVGAGVFLVFLVLPGPLAGGPSCPPLGAGAGVVAGGTACEGVGTVGVVVVEGLRPSLIALAAARALSMFVAATMKSCQISAG